MGNCLKCFKKQNNDSVDGNVTTESVIEQRNVISRDVFIRGEADRLLSHNNMVHRSNVGLDLHLNTNAKNSIVYLNGNANNMGDIITTVKEHQVSDNTLNALFEEYKDAQEDAILSDGIERLCNDLGYKPDEFPILVLAWRLNASQMCRFTKSEFIQGLQIINADTIEEIRLRLEQIIDKLKTDAEMFKQLYRFTFRFGLEHGHRLVTLDMAIILWRLVYTVKTPEILSRWLYFLEQHPHIRGVTKDTWNMFLNFAEICDITSYDDTEAWPSLFDDFVEYENERLKKIQLATTQQQSTNSENENEINNNNYNYNL